MKIGKTITNYPPSSKRRSAKKAIPAAVVGEIKRWG